MCLDILGSLERAFEIENYHLPPLTLSLGSLFTYIFNVYLKIQLFLSFYLDFCISSHILTRATSCVRLIKSFRLSVGFFCKFLLVWHVNCFYVSTRFYLLANWLCMHLSRSLMHPFIFLCIRPSLNYHIILLKYWKTQSSSPSCLIHSNLSKATNMISVHRGELPEVHHILVDGSVISLWVDLHFECSFLWWIFYFAYCHGDVTVSQSIVGVAAGKPRYFAGKLATFRLDSGWPEPLWLLQLSLASSMGWEMLISTRFGSWFVTISHHWRWKVRRYPWRPVARRRWSPKMPYPSPCCTTS